MIAALQVLPSGFALPPLPILVGLVLGTLIVTVLLVVLKPTLDGWDVLALGAWMAVGASLHVLEVLGAIPGPAAPLFGAPAVYATTYVAAGLLLLVAAFGEAAGVFSSTARIVGGVGTGLWIALAGLIVNLGVTADAIAPVWPVVALFAAVLVAAGAYIGLSLFYTEAVATTGKVGAFLVFGHALDGTTTAVGVDVLGVGERTPLPRLIMDVAAGLPTAQYVGRGWLFVLVKVLLALTLVAVFADYVDEFPSRGNALMAALTAVGFGPGVHNLLLFLVSG